MDLTKRIAKEYRSDLIAFGVIFLALVLRMSYFGFAYYPQLDDYIHYKDYPQNTDFIRLCIDNGLFSSRPFAALFDLIFWGRMPLYPAALIVALMHALSGVLFLRLFRRYFSTGYFFVVFYALLPLGFEGTYWLSASTRVVPPLFFAALALTAFEGFCRTRKGWYLAPYVLCLQMSFMFYEQMLVLSLALSLMMVLAQLMLRQWHGLWGLLAFVPVAAYAAFTGYFSNADSGLGSRMAVILPTDEAYFTTFWPELTEQLDAAFTDGFWLTLGKGFRRGLELILGQGVWSAVLIPALLPGVYLASVRCRSEEKGPLFHLAPVFGLLAALAPVTPFFIIDDPWFSLRNTVGSFLGAALVLDYSLRLLLRSRTAVASVALAFVCLVASVSELHDYKLTAEHNERVVTSVLEADETYDLSGAVGILGVSQSYLTDQNYLYHDHIISAHASDWALLGAVNYYLGGQNVDYVPTPLPTDGEAYWYVWNKSIRDPSRFDQLFRYDHERGTMEPLTVVSSEKEHLLYDADGTLCGRVWQDEQGYGRIEFYDETGRLSHAS